MKKLFNLFLILILTFSFNCYSQNDIFDYGHIESGIYNNDFFNVSLNLPTDWIIQSKEQIEHIANAGKELVGGELKEAIKANEINSANLLALFQFELGSPVEYNANMMVVVENLRFAPGVKNGSDYLFHARRIIQQSQIRYDFLSDQFEREMINSTEFYKMTGQINYMGQEINQVYYSTVIKGFSFNIIISYLSEEQKETLLKSINSIKFKN